MSKPKSGDRYFLRFKKPIILTLDKFVNESYWSCTSDSEEIFSLGEMIFESELTEGSVEGNQLIKIKNDLHLLQLQLKYS